MTLEGLRLKEKRQLQQTMGWLCSFNHFKVCNIYSFIVLLLFNYCKTKKVVIVARLEYNFLKKLDLFIEGMNERENSLSLPKYSRELFYMPHRQLPLCFPRERIYWQHLLFFFMLQVTGPKCSVSFHPRPMSRQKYLKRSCLKGYFWLNRLAFSWTS